MGRGSSPASAGETIQVSIGPASPGASTRRISGQGMPRRQAPPRVVRARTSARGRVRAPASAGPTVSSSIGRSSTVATTETTPPATPSVQAAISASVRLAGAPVGWPVAGSTGNRHGRTRPRSLTRATRAPGPSHAGPGRDEAIQPLRSVSFQAPIGRSRSGARATAGAGRSASGAKAATKRPGCSSSRGSATSTPEQAIQRPSGAIAGDPAYPARRRTSRGSEVIAAAPPPAPEAARARVSIAQIEGSGRRSASGRGSAAKTSQRPSGDQAIPFASASWCVSRRGVAPSRTGPTQAASQRSRWPTSSQRQSVRVIRRAVTTRPFVSLPTTKRASGTAAT